MSEPQPLTDLSDDAIDWQVLLHSGNASQADRERYQRWRGLSAEHLAAAEEAEALWGDLGHTQAAMQLPKAPRRRHWGSAIAASLLAAMLGYGGWQQARRCWPITTPAPASAAPSPWKMARRSPSTAPVRCR